MRPGIFGATVHTPQLTATLYRYGAGSSWEEHQHPQDQITTVLEGAIDFVVAGEPVHLKTGELATLPGGTPHSATVPNDGDRSGHAERVHASGVDSRCLTGSG